MAYYHQLFQRTYREGGERDIVELFMQETLLGADILSPQAIITPEKADRKHFFMRRLQHGRSLTSLFMRISVHVASKLHTNNGCVIVPSLLVSTTNNLTVCRTLADRMVVAASQALDPSPMLMLLARLMVLDAFRGTPILNPAQKAEAYGTLIHHIKAKSRSATRTNVIATAIDEQMKLAIKEGFDSLWKRDDVPPIGWVERSVNVKLVPKIAYLQFLKGLSLLVHEGLLSARDLNAYRRVLEAEGELAAAQQLV